MSCFVLLKTEGFHQPDDVVPQVVDDRGEGVFVGVLVEI